MSFAMAVEFAHLLGCMPLAWLVGLRICGQRVRAAEWWLALALGMSFVADSVGGLWPGSYGLAFSNYYILPQATLLAIVYLTRRDAATILGALTITAITSVMLVGPQGKELLLFTVASLVCAWIALRAVGVMRWALLVLFGAGTLAWWVDATWTSCCWLGATTDAERLTWAGYQLTRVIGTALFCAATARRIPRLAMVPSA